ncbi:unnamed protein product [Schistosoma curassoni]|uniref:Uncharacterized protein n=1 Tax=Schistosoma curassoni TaxID=6186 RepID=A0A183JRK0_9TREM|nr:unnamed protein product [Schistosoma curassoni]
MHHFTTCIICHFSKTFIDIYYWMINYSSIGN